MTETAHAPAAEPQPETLDFFAPESPGARPLMMSARFGDLMLALAKAQGEFPPIPRDKTVTVRLKNKQTGEPAGSYTHKYAPLETIIDKTRPALAKHGIALMQAPVMVQEGGHSVEMLRTILFHGEQWASVDIPMFVSSGDNKSQAYGSGMTYSKRYGYSAALCVAADADEDDDGNGGEQDRPRPDYERSQPRQMEPGRFPRGRDGYTEPRDKPQQGGPRAPQRRQDARGAQDQQQRAPAHHQRDQGPTAAAAPPPDDHDAQFQDDPLPDFGLKQFMDTGVLETDGARHDADGVITSPWGTDLTAGEVAMCKARAKVAGLDEAGILKLCGVIRTATVSTALALLKREADKALDAGA